MVAKSGVLLLLSLALGTIFCTLGEQLIELSHPQNMWKTLRDRRSLKGVERAKTAVKVLPDPLREDLDNITAQGFCRLLDNPTVLGRCVSLPLCEIFLLNHYTGYTSQYRTYVCDRSKREKHVCCPVYIKPPNDTVLFQVHDPRFTPKKHLERSKQQKPLTNSLIASVYEYCGLNSVAGTILPEVKDAVPHSWPWMVAIFAELNEESTGFCGGTLVTRQHVITAAHCVENLDGTPLKPDMLSVCLGAHDLQDPEEVGNVDLLVEDIIRHAEFDGETYAHDIAILKIENRVDFTDMIRPICLPFDMHIRTMDLSHQYAHFIGWGHISEEGPELRHVLGQGTIEILNPADCQIAFTADLNVTSNYICAGNLDGRVDACEGYSGGPLMKLVKIPDEYKARWFLIGVTSSGKDYRMKGYPGIYTRVTEYLDWIQENIK